MVGRVLVQLLAEPTHLFTVIFRVFPRQVHAVCGEVSNVGMRNLRSRERAVERFRFEYAHRAHLSS